MLSECPQFSVGVLQVISWWVAGFWLPKVLEVCLMVNFSCSGYPPSPVIWLSESWGRIGQAIDRTDTAQLCCCAEQVILSDSSTGAEHRASRLSQLSLSIHLHRYFLFDLVECMFHCMTILGESDADFFNCWQLIDLTLQLYWPLP